MISKNEKQTNPNNQTSKKAKKQTNFKNGFGTEYEQPNKLKKKNFKDSFGTDSELYSLVVQFL